jgi:hypothetical protein
MRILRVAAIAREVTKSDSEENEKLPAINVANKGVIRPLCPVYFGTERAGFFPSAPLC